MRMRFFSIAICAFTILSVAAQEKKTYNLEVGQFDRLEVTDNVTVVYRCVPDSSGYIAFEGEPEFADAFIFTNNKGKLKIQVNTDDVNNPRLPVLRVYSDYLVEVENSSEFLTTVYCSMSVPTFSAKLVGNGKIVAENVQAGEVNATIATGNGTIVLDGKAAKATYKMVGTGLIQADRIECADVKCSILGSGNIGCWATQKLDVRGIGSTKIYYKGEPNIKKVGGGKLFRISAEGDSSYSDISEQ